VGCHFISGAVGRMSVLARVERACDVEKLWDLYGMHMPGYSSCAEGVGAILSACDNAACTFSVENTECALDAWECVDDVDRTCYARHLLSTDGDVKRASLGLWCIVARGIFVLSTGCVDVRPLDDAVQAMVDDAFALDADNWRLYCSTACMLFSTCNVLFEVAEHRASARLALYEGYARNRNACTQEYTLMERGMRPSIDSMGLYVCKLRRHMFQMADRWAAAAVKEHGALAVCVPERMPYTVLDRNMVISLLCMPDIEQVLGQGVNAENIGTRVFRVRRVEFDIVMYGILYSVLHGMTGLGVLGRAVAMSRRAAEIAAVTPRWDACAHRVSGRHHDVTAAVNKLFGTLLLSFNRLGVGMDVQQVREMLGHFSYSDSAVLHYNRYERMY